MPNIEMYGVIESPETKRLEIFKLFEGKPYLKDMVVTLINSSVYDYLFTSQPFLRLVTTSSEHTDEILTILKEKSGMDVEFLELTGFYPRVSSG